MRQYAALAALATTGAVLGADRLSATEKGSLLIYSGAEGTIHISNDYPADVRLQSYIVNDACESYDMAFSLTANQITAFSTESLAAPFGDGDSSVSMYVWAVNGDNAQIRWNHLSGGVIGSGAYASAAAMQGSNGDAVGQAGVINMDGVEYSSAFNGATYNFAADSDMLTIELLDHDFADKNAADPNTKIVAEIWNENEVKFSGTSRCVSCIESAGLSDWSDSSVNFFRASSLGTALGKARLSTEANASCGSDDNPSSERAFLASSGGAGSVAGTGMRSASITYELESEPEEAGKRVRKAFGLLRK
jgi:FlaG/FlaF family flagellin (archaellin)